MRNLRVLVSLSTMAATAGCVETMGSGYPATSYGGSTYSQPSYYSQPTYYSRPSYYSTPQPVVVTQTRYVPVPVSQPRSSYRGMRDSDGDGIPNRYDRDKNGDGIPDRYQRR
jgi:hypothetical protein